MAKICILDLDLIYEVFLKIYIILLYTLLKK